MNLTLGLVIAAGALAVLYGILQTSALMRAPTGNDRMREIAAAIQEGAQAYLRRQYMTIAMVGVVVLVVLGFLIGWRAALGFLIGSVLSGAAGFVGRRHSASCRLHHHFQGLRLGHEGRHAGP